LKFSPPDSQVFLTAKVEEDTIRISVADQGIGITKDEIPRIFERFHQAGEVMTREAEGAGLGLYITKRLVEAMGGEISVESSPGEGTTFRVTLPLRTAEEPSPNGQEPNAALSSPNAEIKAPS
jgi:signal transduction histidine kinase